MAKIFLFTEILDASALQQIRESAPEDPQSLLRELVAMFKDITPPVIASLHAAIARGDLDGLNKQAHFLKSSCGTLGLQRLRELCQDLEDFNAPEGRFEVAGDLLNLLESEYEKALIALENELV